MKKVCSKNVQNVDIKKDSVLSLALEARGDNKKG